jgi:hypothetical protein
MLPKKKQIIKTNEKSPLFSKLQSCTNRGLCFDKRHAVQNAYEFGESKIDTGPPAF